MHPMTHRGLTEKNTANLFGAQNQYDCTRTVREWIGYQLVFSINGLGVQCSLIEQGRVPHFKPASFTAGGV